MPPVEFSIEEHTGGIALFYSFELGWNEQDFIAIWDDVRAALARYPGQPVIAIWQFAPYETFANVRNMVQLIRRIGSNDLNTQIRFTYVVFSAQAAGRLIVDTMGKFMATLFRLPFEVVETPGEAREKLPDKWAEIAASTARQNV